MGIFPLGWVQARPSAHAPIDHEKNLSAQVSRVRWEVVRLPDPWNWETIYYTRKQIYLHSDQDLVPRVRGGDCSQPTPEKVHDDFSEPAHPRKLISWKLGSPGRPLSNQWCLDVLVYQEGCENQSSSWSTIFKFNLDPDPPDYTIDRFLIPRIVYKTEQREIFLYWISLNLTIVLRSNLSDLNIDNF